MAYLYFDKHLYESFFQLKSLGLIQQIVTKLGLDARGNGVKLTSSFMTPIFREMSKHSVNSPRF